MSGQVLFRYRSLTVNRGCYVTHSSLVSTVYVMAASGACDASVNEVEVVLLMFIHMTN